MICLLDSYYLHIEDRVAFVLKNGINTLLFTNIPMRKNRIQKLTSVLVELFRKSISTFSPEFHKCCLNLCYYYTRYSVTTGKVSIKKFSVNTSYDIR